MSVPVRIFGKALFLVAALTALLLLVGAIVLPAHSQTSPSLNGFHFQPNVHGPLPAEPFRRASGEGR